MKIEKEKNEYNLKIIKFLLYRSIKDLEKLIECAELIIEDGIGSAHLDEITNKKFTDRENDYFKRIRFEVENNSRNIEHLFKALVEWYQSWSDEYEYFDKDNSKYFFEKNKIKTWTHCILSGDPELFIALSDENYQVLTAEDIENLDLAREVKKEYIALQSDTIDIKETLLQMRKSEKLTEYEKSFKERIKGKSLGIFMEGEWNQSDIEKLYSEYRIKHVNFESAINQPRGIKNYDFVILVTSRAAHSVSFKLKNEYQDKLFLSESMNFKKVISEFRKQIMGYYYDE